MSAVGYLTTQISPREITLQRVSGHAWLSCWKGRCALIALTLEIPRLNKDVAMNHVCYFLVAYSCLMIVAGESMTFVRTSSGYDNLKTGDG